MKINFFSYSLYQSSSRDSRFTKIGEFTNPTLADTITIVVTDLEGELSYSYKALLEHSGITYGDLQQQPFSLHLPAGRFTDCKVNDRTMCPEGRKDATGSPIFLSIPF